MVRRLISTKRVVGEERIAAYGAAWNRVVGAAGNAPGRVNAWRFRAASDPRAFIEFLEFSDESDPRFDPALAGPLRALDAIAPATSEEWEDAPTPVRPDENA